MFRNYLKIAIRNLLRNKVFSIINIAGLSIGISACILIFLYIQTELSYDTHWKGADRIARINWEESKNGITDFYGVTSYAAGPSLKENFPEVESATRMQQYNKITISYADNYFNEDKNFYVDSNFMDVFDFELLYGNPKTCLREPNAVVISEDMSKRFFGNNDPIGKILKYPKKLYKVTGVLKNNSTQAHFKPNSLLILDYSNKQIQEQQGNWLWIQTYTYVKLKSASSLANFDAKLKQWAKKILEPVLKKENIEYTIVLKSELVKDIHFDALHLDGLFDKTDKSHIYIFGWVAFFILIIACFNYMNLSTARATKRAKEVGMRKVSGASRKQLIEQFLGESFVLSAIALVLAIVMLLLFLPAFNSLTNKSIEVNSLFLQAGFWYATLSIILFISLVGGSYPALYLSGFQPINVLKGKLSLLKDSHSGGFNLRQLLVTIQFTISIVIIIATIIVYDQLRLMKNKDLGFNKEQVLVLTLREFDSTEINTMRSFKNELLRNPQIRKFSTTNQIISTGGNLLFRVRANGKNSQASLNINSGDRDYLDLLDIKLMKGRNFSDDIATDKKNFIINESTVKFLNLHDPLETELSLEEGVYGKVIGVVRDFNYKSPHTKIEPLVLVLNDVISPLGSLALIKLAPQNIPQSIEFISKRWKDFFPKNPIDYFFLDKEFDTQYHKEDTMLGLFSCFAALTIFISCLGLFGLASFVAEQRTKEIGIRKIIGASLSNIVYLISRDFLILVFIAILIGSPIAYYFLHSWLQNFDYRTGINWWVFAASGFLIVAIAFVTTGSLAFKAAVANPVKSLRTE